MKKTILTLTIMVMAAALLAAFSCPAAARVTGVCSNCHTMHNSQGGAEMATFGGETGANDALVRGSCVGCHTGTNDGTNTTPYVYSTTEPTFGTNTLAGGNFYWVGQGNDAKGHNIFSDNPDSLSEAPGDGGFAGCGTNDCHTNLHAISSGTVTVDNRQGCTKCHMVKQSCPPTGFHHADDGDFVSGAKLVSSFPWYRFLHGHMSAMNDGVEGIEHEKWNYAATASSHNEYLGYVKDGSYGMGSSGLYHAMSGYCTGCHGVFHQGQKSGGNWIRHPSDAVIPNSGEYASISTTYNPNVPVARASGHTVWTNEAPSGTVAAGTDMVMCLSCHVAHGSPYDDMLRWNYGGMIAGGGGDDGTGCFVCHTEKDGS